VSWNIAKFNCHTPLPSFLSLVVSLPLFKEARYNVVAMMPSQVHNFSVCVDKQCTPKSTHDPILKKTTWWTQILTINAKDLYNCTKICSTVLFTSILPYPMRENAMNSSVSKGKSILKFVLKSAVIVSEKLWWIILLQCFLRKYSVK
jgi:hypothetical protein